MRLAGILLSMGMVVGCASPQVADQNATSATTPTPQAQTPVAANGEPATEPAATQDESAPAAAPAAGAKTATTERSLPKRSGYKVVTKDGKQLYCSREPVTGSLLQSKAACYTAEELDRLSQSSREAVNEVSRRATPTAGGS